MSLLLFGQNGSKWVKNKGYLSINTNPFLSCL